MNNTQKWYLKNISNSVINSSSISQGVNLTDLVNRVERLEKLFKEDLEAMKNAEKYESVEQARNEYLTTSKLLSE